ncbi:2-hydroxychromene-2-carboxylate isomerase [Cupriavidus basilensis]|uniref:2-hydroxychromene-2-carboxylate isomerase n=1 Tax=Cupriavidus basilensis TaxID=68895 RepID=A0ABT6AQS0_9BURK|nr:2-hydroxychromene-2-carboxylate isomerase [Cupriavidus basilensis]MDF3834932.1 2-hydroxychromene-2-carboxylate isomerase [Cupriavidus basilensis]
MRDTNAIAPIKVQFQFDFGSPNSYFSHKVIPGIEARQGVRFEYVPVLLGGLFRLTGNRSPAEAFAGIKNKPEFGRLEMHRFVARHALHAYRHNPFWPVNTLQIMRGAVAAQKNGTFVAYVDAVFAHMWEQGLKMDDPQVIATALDAAGLDGVGFQARIEDPEVKQQLMANTQAAFERGAFGSPTFFVGDEMYFGKDQLRDVEEEIQRSKAERP